MGKFLRKDLIKRQKEDLKHLGMKMTTNRRFDGINLLIHSQISIQVEHKKAFIFTSFMFTKKGADLFVGRKVQAPGVIGSDAHINVPKGGSFKSLVDLMDLSALRLWIPQHPFHNDLTSTEHFEVLLHPEGR